MAYKPRSLLKGGYAININLHKCFARKKNETDLGSQTHALTWKIEKSRKTTAADCWEEMEESSEKEQKRWKTIGHLRANGAGGQ